MKMETPGTIAGRCATASWVLPLLAFVPVLLPGTEQQYPGYVPPAVQARQDACAVTMFVLILAGLALAIWSLTAGKKHLPPRRARQAVVGLILGSVMLALFVAFFVFSEPVENIIWAT